MGRRVSTPIRLDVTRTVDRSLRLRFAWRGGVLALLLAVAVGLGLGLYWQGRVEDAVHTGVADHLRSLEAELDLGAVPLSTESEPFVLPSPERFVQVVTPDGHVVASSSELTTSEPLLPVETVPAAGEAFEAEVSHPNRAGEQAFVMARRIAVDGVDYVGIVGESLAPVSSGTQFFYAIVAIGAPILALLVAAVVWLSVKGALRPVNEMTGEADRISKGSGPWRLGVVPDTVELRRLASSLDALLAQIDGAFERERRFLDDASHELRTPIAVARGELDLAQAMIENDEETAKALESAIEELDRLDRLAADLLILARARGPARAPMTRCDLGGMARRVAGAEMRRSPNERIALRVSGEATTRGDEQALDRVLANVVSNAVDFAASRVDVELTTEDGEAVITVIDDGPGFPPGFLEDAFTRFARQRVEGGGAGLGLAIASAIVSTHGGTISAVNDPQGGARVTIRLPAAPEVRRSAGVSNSTR